MNWINDVPACGMPQRELISYAVPRTPGFTIHFLQGQGSANGSVIMLA